MSIGIDAIGYALPSRVVSNQDLRASYPDWDWPHLEKRTGVLSRHIAGPDETAVDFAEQACRALMAEGRLDLETIDALIFCTETPDHTIPPNATVLHGRLEMRPSVWAFDINLGCSGFVYGLALARSLILSRSVRRVLFATGDTYSRLINEGDRSARSLFGDGSAVTVLSSRPKGGVLDVEMATSGRHGNRFIVRAGGTRMPRSAETAIASRDRSGNLRAPDNIEMDGLGVLTFFNNAVPSQVRLVLERNGLHVSDVDLFVFHQASDVALKGIQRSLSIPDEKMFIAIHDIGNLVSASIPVALRLAIEQGRVGEGSLVFLCGFGVGLSWGSILLKL